MWTTGPPAIPLVGFAPSRSLPLPFEFASGYLIAEAGFDNSEVRLPSMAPFLPSDVGSLKPSALLLRGGTVSPPNLAVTYILQYHLTDMRLSKATKPQSTVAIFTRNIELHSLGLLHCFQPYISEAECSTLPHVSSTRVPHLVPWPCCSVGQLPRESLGNSARTTCHRFATANHPCTSPRCARRGPATLLRRTLITTIHLRHYCRSPPRSHRAIGAPTTRVHQPSFSTNHHSF
jgi:hypothetical protein